MGTPQFAVPVLSALIDAGHDICTVYTQPPRKAGRGKSLRKSPVHQFCQQHGLEVITPDTLKSDEAVQRFASHKADACVVVAYGQILPPAILAAPTSGCFNVHASLLPRWRGAAPIHRAIMAGDSETGISIMRMDSGLDTGPVCLAEKLAISDTTTTAQLHDALAQLGAKLMVDALDLLEKNRLTFTPQPAEGVTYASKIDKAEAHINFNRTAKAVVRHINGLSPFPGAWLDLPIDGKPTRVKILSARIGNSTGTPGTVIDASFTIACKSASICPTRLQREGKTALDLKDFLKGTAISPGTVVG